MIRNSEEKKQMLLIRVTEAEKTALREKAAEYHLNISRYLIMMGLRGRVQ